MIRLPLALTLATLLSPVAVFAQQGTPTTTPGQGLVIERIENGFVIAPDYKLTDLDGDLAHLAGAYGGWLADRTLLIGGAFYTVTNRSDDFELTYGGLVGGWTVFPDHRIQFGARGLVGFGRATLGADAPFARFGRRGSRRNQVSSVDGQPGAIRFNVEEDLFVFEPQFTMSARLSRHISINLGAGYRLTAYGDVLDDRVNGATGSIGVQFGGW
jgi:hypothetical protein